MPTLLVTKRVSFNPYSKKGYQSKGTKAFVPLGTKMPKKLSRELKMAFLRGLAQESTHFIKPVSKRNREIRGFLLQHGIRVEKIIVDLKDGTCLFERKGDPLGSIDGRKIFARNPEKITQRLLDIFSKLVVLEVSHHHLHMGNFSITSKGELILLDLGQATIGGRGRKRTSAAIMKKRIQNETNLFLDSLISYSYRTLHNKTPTRSDANSLKKKLFGQLLQKEIAFAKKMETV